MVFLLRRLGLVIAWRGNFGRRREIILPCCTILFAGRRYSTFKGFLFLGKQGILVKTPLRFYVGGIYVGVAKW